MSNPRWAAANWVRPQMVGCEQEPCETPLQEGPGSSQGDAYPAGSFFLLLSLGCLCWGVGGLMESPSTPVCSLPNLP